MRRSAAPNSNESNDAFDEYKVIMEEIKREHPDLTPNVVQQMAVERFSIVKEKTRSHSQTKLINEMFAGMSIFRFGMSKDKTSAPLTSNNNDNTNDTEDRRRCLNPRLSVSNIDSRPLSQSFVLGISSDGEDSLENSLQNIDASFKPPRRESSRCGRMSSMKRDSLTKSLTELVDVQEDKELHALIPDTLGQSHQDLHSSKNCSGSQKETITDRKGSLSDDLPDEIKAALAEYDNDDGQRSLGSGGSQRNRINKSIRSSLASSFASIDSANFEGDFSAWGYTSKR
jgi:hypothetical protein